jgi:hypothetical protein
MNDSECNESMPLFVLKYSMFSIFEQILMIIYETFYDVKQNCTELDQN